MHPLEPPAAVLVRLDLDHCGLRRPGDSGDAEGVWIGLLELVGRPVHDELAKLFGARARCEEARE
jgi:hypothetical protein